MLIPQAILRVLRWPRPTPACLHDSGLGHGHGLHGSLSLSLSLLSPDVETAADAWNDYRRLLIGHLRQALVVGLPWPEILVRLSGTYSDTAKGYPRLVNYINAALEATALLKYPLLHADLIIYLLDCSYATGSNKYSYDSVTVDWERACSRQPGEDPVTLARRVTNAFLMKNNDPSYDDVSVWSNLSFANQINTRYAECLRADEADPDRGLATENTFLIAWHTAKAELQRAPSLGGLYMSCERLAEVKVVPAENVNCCDSTVPEDVSYRVTYQSHRTGAGARARRDAARAAERANRSGLPPPAYMPDTIPE